MFHQIKDIVLQGQVVLMGLCIFGLVCIGVLFLLHFAGPHLETVWRRWLRLDGLGKAITAICFVAAVMYGGSKQESPWTRVSNCGADTGITLVGVYTQTSNDVQVVGDVTTTNKIYMLAVMWTGGTVDTTTPVSYRQSDTNRWEELSGITPTLTTDNTTNILTYILSSKMDYAYWWVGEDKPAVVVVGAGITITGYSETANYVDISWTCNQPLATEFLVYKKKHTATTWTLVATTSDNSVRVTGFHVGEDTDWKVTATYLEDGE